MLTYIIQSIITTIVFYVPTLYRYGSIFLKLA